MLSSTQSIRENIAEEKWEESENPVPPIEQAYIRSRSSSRHQWLKKKSMNRNTCHVNTWMQNVNTKDWKEKIEREPSQKLPGKGRRRAKCRKKRGVWVGRVFRLQPSCQSINPLKPRAVPRVNCHGLSAQLHLVASLQGKCQTGQC